MRKIKKIVIQKILTFIINKLKIQKDDFSHYKYFNVWQKNGFHITPNHFYQPIPDTSKLSSTLFKKKSKMVGVDMNKVSQSKLLNSFSKFRGEYKHFKELSKSIDDQKDPKFYFGNLAFDNVDALSYYSMIRLFKPRRIVEVGSGWSTKIAAAAALANKKTELVIIEPFPQPILQKGFPGLTKVTKKRVQDIPLTFFDSLNGNDMLFIDSSHTVKTGGDVNYLLLEVIPRLQKGVFVHVHDIFFPYDYPKKWVLDEHRFWAEQYLLQAFLSFNDSFEVVYCSSYMADNFPAKVKKAFPGRKTIKGGSIWIRRTENFNTEGKSSRKV